MAHLAPCPRACADIAPLLSASATPNTGMPLRQNQHSDFEDALTWQQREDLNAQEPKRRYRARKASKYFLLDAEAATASAEPSALEYGTFVQQTEVKAANTQSRACGKARTRSPPQQSKQAAPPNSIPPPEDLRAVEQKPQSNRKTRKKRKPSVQANMTAEPTGAYVPPHKRNKRLPAAVGLIPKTKTEAKTEPKSKPKTLGKTEPKADVRLGDLEDVIGISTTPPASVKSQLSKPTEDEVFPDGTNPEVYIPPSPPTTEEPPRAPAMLAWDDPKPVENRPLPKRNNPRWPRPTGAPKEKHIWPKAREIPKELSAGSESDGGVTFRSDSGGDPSYDVQKLMNWHGDWLPPPEDWAARKSLTSRHFGQEIEKWASEHGRSCNKVMDIQSPDFIGIKSEHGDWVNKDLVPRYWLHEVIDNSPPREFWKQAPHRAPAPMSDVDATETPPYWERWNHKQPENCFMANLVVPEARIDKDDKENELESPYAMLCVEERIAMVEAIQQEKKRRRHARRNRPVFTAKDEGLSAPDRQLKPKANIYLRPVRPADIPGIMVSNSALLYSAHVPPAEPCAELFINVIQTIYNHYVKDTVHASELEEQTEGQIRVWIDGIVRSGLPCLVAVSKRSQRRGRQGYVMEPIVGFTCLSEFADSSSIFRFSFELETYVHPGYLQQGIGKCLLDQIVFMCNTGYQQRGGYQYAGEYEYLKTGHSRTIKTVVANVHYEKGKEEETEWATSYLGDFGFKKAGRLSQIGHKAGKVISKIIFQMHTTEVIDPLSIPTIQP